MTDPTIHARAGGASDLRWIFVLGLTHAIQHGLRPASLPSSICRAPDTLVAAGSII